MEQGVGMMKRLGLCILYLIFGVWATGAVANASWEPTGQLREARTEHTATLLPSGKVLVTGGGTASAELYDPDTGRWQRVGELGSNRRKHTATLLASGKVLVTCGEANSSQSCAELYDPETGTWETTGAPVSRRQDHTATPLPSGQVLIAGGERADALSSAELYDPAAGTWSSTSSLATPRTLHTATLLPSGEVLVVGGYDDGTWLASAELYDPSTGTWQSTGSLAEPRRAHTATLLPSGMVLVVGGEDAMSLPSAELYDPSTGFWQSTGSLTTARGHHTATLLPSGEVLVAGGNENGGYLSSTELYDPSTGQWSAGPSLLSVRELHTATLLASGEVLVAGGTESVGLSSAELYDRSSGAWRTTGALTTPRSWHSTTLLTSGEVLSAGGYDGSNHHSSSELYDPLTETWTATGDLVHGRSQHTATRLLSGEVLVAGGRDGGGGVVPAELYDPGSGTWQGTGSLLSPRYRHTATLLRSGRVLVVGGFLVPSTELFDPMTGVWESAGELSTARFAHTATLLLSGQVLVVGGFSGGSSLTSVERYDPETGSWESMGALDQPRGGHTATLLPSGKVLVTGGLAGGDLVSAEIYDPSTDTWQSIAPLATSRFQHAAALLPSGEVLVVGGISGADSIGDGPSVASAELYDPATGTWSAAGALASARRRHDTVALLSGEILIAGGDNVNVVNGDYLASAELYTRSSLNDASRAPTIETVPAAIGLDDPLLITGDRFGSDSEGGGGESQSTAVGFPLVQMRTFDGDRRFWLTPETLPSFLDNPATLTIDQFPVALDPGPYLLRVISAGVPSEAEPIEVECGLEIVEQPTNQTVAIGATPTFSVEARGVRYFQWQRDGISIPGATGPSYTAPPVIAADSGVSYRVRVDSGCVTEASSPDTLAVDSEAAAIVIADAEPPEVEVASPAGGEYWLLSEPGEPSAELVTWQMSDDIRVCQVSVALLFSNDGGQTWPEAPPGGGLPATFGTTGPCAHPGESTTSLTYSVPETPPSGSPGSLYKISVRVTDQAGNLTEVTSAAPFFIVRANPDAVETLILSHLSRMRSVVPISQAEADNLETSLEDLAAHPKVQGRVIDLGLVASLSDLYAAWDVDPGDPQKANDVLFADGGLHDYLLNELLPTYTGVEHLVLVGDDRIVPMARLEDRTGLVESVYPAGGDLTPGGSTVGMALAADRYLSDDLLATMGPVTLPLEAARTSEGTFLPELGIGRLVETPAEIVGTIANFISHDGVVDLASLDPESGHKVLVTGYDFLADSALKIRRRWNEALGMADSAVSSEPVDGRLVSQTWGVETVAERRSLLRQGLAGGGTPYAIASLNGHATHYEEGVPGEHPQDIQGLPSIDVYGDDLCSSPTLGAVDLSGSLVYAVGCHGGLSVPGSCASDADRSLDLPQTFLARGSLGYLANSGYGWGLVGGIGYGERLLEIFTEELTTGGSPRLGDLVRRSKLRYFMESAGFDPYDQKTLLQWTLYGLPMVSVRTGIASALVETSAERVEVERVEVENQALTKSLPANVVQLSLAFDFSAEGVYEKYDADGGEVTEAGCPHPDGCYYTLNGLVERGTATVDQPVEPYLVYDSRLSGTSQHGALWLGGHYEEEENWRPVIAELASNGGDFSDHGTAPRLPRRKITSRCRRSAIDVDPLCRVSDGELNSLVVVAGESVAEGAGEPFTVHRLFLDLELEVFYFNDGGLGGNCDREGPDLPAPAPGESYHEVMGDELSWAVPASDTAGVWRVVVVYDVGAASDGTGSWEALELADDGTGTWRGSLAVPGIAQLTYFLQAVDNRGNVSWLDFEPLDLPASGVEPDLPLAIDVVLGADGAIFSDDFESGDVLRWSSEVGF